MGDKTRVQLKQLICKGRTEQVELKKQLKQGHKKVQLQGDKKCVYLMMLDTPLNRREGKKAPERNISNCIYIQQPLGRGGFGIVYKAELMMKEKRKLCIKMALHKRKYKDVQDRAAGQEDINKSLLREAACYKKLSAKSHANVISMDFYCFSEDRNEVLLALEYCKGVNLSHIIKHYRNKSMPSKLLHKVMVESTLAIEYCLSHNIVHCDVKPPNILFSSMEAPLKLIDLGCAVDLDELMEGDRGVAGTWWYMAPELLLNGLPGVQLESDIYSLGATLLHMVSRKAPWSHDEQVRAAWKNRKVRWEIKSIITEKYKAYDDYLKSREVYDQTSIKPTVLQLALEEYSVVAPKECKLISKMLSFYHYDRPTFTHIKESINNLIKEKSLAKSSSSGEATSYIPATIASYEASSSRGWVQTTLSTEAKDLLAVGALSTIAPISGMERDSLSYGPPSDYSFQADDMREDYDAALADENFDKEERMKHLKEEMALVIANNERERGELEKARAELERKAEELERKKAEMELTAQIWSLLPSFSLPDDAALARVLQMLTWEGESENIMRQLAIYPDARRRLVQRMLQVFSSQIDDQACSGAIVTNQYHRKRHIIPIVDPDTNAVLNAEVSDQTPASEDKSLQLSQEALCQASGSLLHTNVNNASLHSTLKSSSAADSSGPCLLANHSIHLVPKAKFDSTSNDTTFFATYSSNNEMTAIYPRTAAPSTMSNWEWKTAPSTISACPWGTASSTTSSYTSMPTLSSVSRKKNFGWVNDERHQSSLPLNPTSTRLGNAESVPSVEASATPEKNVSFVTTTLHRSKGKASSTKDFSKTPLMVNPKQLIHKVVKSTLDPRTGAKVNELEPMNDYHNEHLFAEHHHTQVMPKLNLDTEAANKQLAVIHESLDSSLKIDCTANSSKNSLMSPIIHHDTKKDVHKLLYLGRMSDNCFPARNAGNDLFLQTKCTAIVESDATSENLGTHSKQRAPRALDPEAVPFSSTVNILTDVQKRSVETHIHSHKKGCDDSLESLASSHSPTMRWNQKDLPIADTMTQEAVNTLSYTQPDTFDKPSQTVAVGKPLLGTRKKVILSIRDPNTGVVLNAQPMVNSSKRLGSSPSVNLPAMLHTEKKPALVDSDVFTSSLQPASIAENAIPSTRTNSALAIVNPNTGAVINETQLLDDGEKLIQRSASVVCPSLPRRKSKAIPILDPETHEVVDTSSYTCFKNCSKFFTIDGHGVGISIIESKENEQ